jgi:hypothetical protein
LIILENFNGTLRNTQLDRCFSHRDIWQNFDIKMKNECQVSVCSTITETLQMIKEVKDNNFKAEINVLFTGSLHLIGSTLSLIKN